MTAGPSAVTQNERGLSPTRRVLPNGLTILAKETRTTPAVTIYAGFHAGTAYDLPDRAGVAHFVSKTIDRGTSSRTAEQLADELENRGVSLSVAVNRHALWLVCTCLSEDFDHILALVGDIAMRPTFPAPEIETRRGEIVTLLRQDQDNPASVAMEALMRELYGAAHAYGRPMRGTLETVNSITVADVQQFHRSRFTPQSMSLAVVGDVEPERAAEVTASVFGDWRGTAPAAIDFGDVPPARARRVHVLPMMNKAQADIAYGFTSIRRRDPQYYAYWLMNNILGQYAMGGRLGDSIRERQGMAYYTFSSLDASLAPGPLIVRAGVSPANVERAVASIDVELAKLADEGPTDQEVAESKQYLIGSMPRTLETNVGIATFLQTAELFGLGLDYDLQLPGLIAAVSRDAVREAALATLQPTHATVVVAGPVLGPTAVTASDRTSSTPAAVFFDVDFTLIYPGPTFQGEGYQRFCASHGITVEPAHFAHAVRAASVILDAQQEHVYDAEIFVRYTQRIIEEMGGTGPALTACATEIYDEWAACHHFHLYDDVAPVLRELDRREVKIGLISNSHRSLASFEEHFELEGLISAAISSSEHGYLKPHPSIFEAALQLAGVRAEESMMVGDSLLHDIEGALSVGMRGVLVHRGDGVPETANDVPVIRTLAELPALIW